MQAPVTRKGWVAGTDYGGEPLGTNSYSPSSLERARDELFSHIRRCGVLEAEFDQREEWLSQFYSDCPVVIYLLKEIELSELQKIGQRYCMPPKPHGGTDAPKDAEEESSDIEGERDEVNAA